MEGTTAKASYNLPYRHTDTTTEHQTIHTIPNHTHHTHYTHLAHIIHTTYTRHTTHTMHTIHTANEDHTTIPTIRAIHTTIKTVKNHIHHTQGKAVFEVTFKNETRRFTPVEISSMVLMKAREIAETHIGREVLDLLNYLDK